MATNIIIRKFEVQDFVSVDHGTENVTLTIFKGDMEVGTPGWAKEIQLSPNQADELAHELLTRAVKVREFIKNKKEG